MPWSVRPGRLRPKTVRAKIVSLLMVPVVSLMALWAFATVTTAGSVSDLTRFQDVNENVLKPVSDYVTAVQDERSAAARYLAHPDPTRLDAVTGSARTTDAAAAALRRGISASSTDAAALDPDLKSRTRRLTDATDRLPELRKRVAAKKTNWGDAYAGYTETIDLGFSVDGALSNVGASVLGRGDGPGIASQPRVVDDLSRAREMITREDALVGSAQADGHMPMDRYRSFVGAVQSQQTLFQSAVDDLRPSDESAYRAVLDGRPYQELHTLERTIEDAGPGRATPQASPATWDRAADPVLQGLHKAQAAASTVPVSKADPFASDVLGGSGVAVVLGLVGVLLSLLISMRIGRGLVVELVDMRNSALELAGSKLPQSLRRLHAGEEVDIDAEVPVQRRGGDEIGQVGSALNAVHRAALQAAAERAAVLSGISGVYVKLARRSQVLLHRQLDLLDTMERRIEDPSDLEDLFRLDHLTTRMRRHAESLIILSGAAPVRGWRRPVPMLDVVRAAVAEVEDFTRVEVRVEGDPRVAGSAVADLTHLVAELVENAVTFSPPHTKVQVRGEKVGAGLALEVEDRGLGMSRRALTQANKKIADASQVDLLDTERLGLFVINRLAHRRGVQVALRSSVYGGVTAVVLIPESQLEQAQPAARPGTEPGPEPGPVESTAPLPRQRTAGMLSRESTAGPLPQEGTAGLLPREGSAGPLPRPENRPPVALPPRPTTAPDRKWHTLSADDGESDGALPPPATPEREAPAGEPSGAQRPGAVPAPEPGDPPWPGAGPAPEPAERPQADAAPAQEPAAQPRERPAGERPTPLPRRVRQASISPHLRDAPTRPPRSVPHIADPTATERSPERARATMAALRAGWLSGGGADGNGGRADGNVDRHTDGNVDPHAEAGRAGGPHTEGQRAGGPHGEAGRSEDRHAEAGRAEDRHAEAGRTEDRHAEGGGEAGPPAGAGRAEGPGAERNRQDLPPLPVRGASPSETPSQGDEA